MDEKLRRTERLQHALEFHEVFDRGKCFRSPALRVHYRRSGRDLSRLGLVVSRRVGKATVRTRVKRLLRDVFRREKARLPEPMDVVLVPQGAPREHAEYLAAFLEFAGRLRAPVPSRS
jgi:ribonuclease P protein component